MNEQPQQPEAGAPGADGPGVLAKGAGQVVLKTDARLAATAARVRDLYRLSDPALSELPFEKLLDELLIRVRELLKVDTAAILLVDESANQLVARAAKGIEEEVEQGVRIPIGRGFAGRIAHERVAIFIADVDHADIMNPILREKGIQSLLGVPLIVESDVIGVLHIGSLRPRKFDERDLAVLELAAARAGPAIERGRLMHALEREHGIAVMLQRSLLPRRLAEIAGVGLAARYLPARDEVGGDWYDMMELPRGQVGIVIGDVVGHGLTAGAQMGQFRTALHAYAAEGHDPARTLELVDRFAVGLGPDAMATAAFARIDADSGKVRLASAGHLPPVVISADGHAEALELATGPPLGTFGYGGCPENEIVLDQGATLLLYTDGLVERPGVRLTDSIEELLRCVDGSQTPEEACLLAMDRMVPPGGARDDVAVIAIQNSSIPEDLDLECPAVPSTLSQLRRALSRWLGDQRVDREIAAEITIAVSEACANAIEHAYGPGPGTFRVTAHRAGDSIEIVVSDRGNWRPPRGTNRGRGLTIMRAAMDDLKVEFDEGGTRIEMSRRLKPV